MLIPNSLDDYVYMCMSNGEWWTFWKLQRSIEHNTKKFYGEPTISAAIRNLRKEHNRIKYNLPFAGEVVQKKKLFNSKGYEYKLLKGESNGIR
tara:strand:- start:3004 stop:3282 length:279 start_codon:yes stop_codon:yes gene_type:complete